MEYYLTFQSGGELPPGVTPPEEPPESLVWLWRVEQWGKIAGALPLGGGWLEQPYYFIQDMEAAMLGRQRFQNLQRINQENRQRWLQSQYRVA